jgi:NAD(P)-dependent dehydrogenase (short-subunit alcohol dehydrogenase family)
VPPAKAAGPILLESTMSAISLVTGGNRGIGREVCRQLAAIGHTVILTALGGGRGGRGASDSG